MLEAQRRHLFELHLAAVPLAEFAQQYDVVRNLPGILSCIEVLRQSECGPAPLHWVAAFRRALCGTIEQVVAKDLRSNPGAPLIYISKENFHSAWHIDPIVKGSNTALAATSRSEAALMLFAAAALTRNEG